MNSCRGLNCSSTDLVKAHIMPRGFAKTIRGDGKTSGIPIIMITSRTAEKHRNRANELGVQRFLGKPYQEDELLQSLRSVIAGAQEVGA